MSTWKLLNCFFMHSLNHDRLWDAYCTSLTSYASYAFPINMSKPSELLCATYMRQFAIHQSQQEIVTHYRHTTTDSTLATEFKQWTNLTVHKPTAWPHLFVPRNCLYDVHELLEDTHSTTAPKRSCWTDEFEAYILWRPQNDGAVVAVIPKTCHSKSVLLWIQTGLQIPPPFTLRGLQS